MDADILIEHKDCFYGDDFLDQLLSKECQWSSLLDAADATPSEILADAVQILVPPISPDLSIKSSPSSSISDSGSEDDSKNSSSGTSVRQSSQSPCDWISGFDDEPSSNLNLEDVELFLQKKAPVDKIPQPKVIEKKGPMVSIENGVIKGIKLVAPKYENSSNVSHIHKGNGVTQNSYFKVVNENSTNNEKPNQKINVVHEAPNICSPPSLVIQPNSTHRGRVAIVPIARNKSSDNIVPAMVESSGTSINLNVNSSSPVVPNIETPTADVEYSTLEFSNCSDAELRAIKKQQRMIKNRESACQSRQKKKEYVSAIEQRLLEAQQEIARLRLENKLLRDQLCVGGRGRKIPRLDTSLFIPKKNIALLFAMVFMVSLNFNVLGWNSKPFVGPSAPHTSTRHLLWTEENSPDLTSSSELDDVTNATYGGDCRNSTKGDVAINQTESIRIAGELTRWIGGGKTLNWTSDAPRRRRHVYLNEKIDNGLLESYKLFKQLNLDPNLIDFPGAKNTRNIRDKSRLRRMRRRDMDFPDNVLNLYHKPLKESIDDFDMDFGEWKALLQALQRRDDTFYVVGVGKGEHLLLPAVTHNDTRPPKMALILPAASGNDSITKGHVTLMQIECSVVNTTLVQLKSDTLPESLRKKNNEELIPTRRHLAHNAKPAGNVTKPRLYDNPKPKHNATERTNMDNVDASLSNLQKLSANTSNTQRPAKKHHTKNVNVDKDDSFANYLFSKYESPKNNSVIKKYDSTVTSDVNVKNGTKSP